MSADLTKLPVGVSDFHTLRKAGMVYVDKTGLIKEMTDFCMPIVFSRPRGFGKTLWVSMFESLFSRGLEDFKGLEIEKSWDDEKTHPVARIDCSDIEGNTKEEIIQAFDNKLEIALTQAGFRAEKSPFPDFPIINRMSIWLNSLRKKQEQIVLLIDNFDAPLLKLLNNPELFNSVRSHLSGFYAHVKGHNSSFRFVFITGIVSARESVFARMNNMDDITLNIYYKEMTGFTGEELEKYFDPYLDNAANVLGMSRTKLIGRLKEQYGGYCFDRRAEGSLYAPQSLLKFLKNPEKGFLNYWDEGEGLPQLTLDQLADDEVKSPAKFGWMQVTREHWLFDFVGMNGIRAVDLLTLVGYFTICRAGRSWFDLTYPNGEVREIFADFYIKQLYRRNPEKLQVISGVVKAITNGNVEELCKIFNEAISNIPKRNGFPLNNVEKVGMFLSLVLSSQQVLALVERTDTKERVDVIGTIGNDSVVIEVKFCYEKGKKPRKRPEDSRLQDRYQIKDKQAGVDLLTKNVLRVALEYSYQERRFVNWQKIE